MRLFFFIFFCNLLIGQQNLVPNWSFENYSQCPNSPGQIIYAVPWFQPNLDGGSSDFYNSCNNPNLTGVPSNAVYQNAKTGSGYAAICLFWDTGASGDLWREYLEVGLLDTLIATKKYCVKLNTSKGNWSSWAIKNIQAILTTDSVTYYDMNYGYIQGYTPVLESPTIITDTSSWTTISAVITAGGGEKFLTIGNFSSGSQSVYQQVWPYSGSPNTLGYYAIDDVSVYELPEVNASKDTLICPWQSTIVGPANVRSDIQYSWSPSYGLSDSMVANPIASPLQTTTYVLTVTDTNQWACYPQMYDTVTITVSGCTGINEINDLSVNVHPNPFKYSTVFSFDLHSEYDIKVSDLAGRKVSENNFTGKDFIYEKELITGVYYYFVQSKEGYFSRGKLIVE